MQDHTVRKEQRWEHQDMELLLCITNENLNGAMYQDLISSAKKMNQEKRDISMRQQDQAYCQNSLRSYMSQTFA